MAGRGRWPLQRAHPKDPTIREQFKSYRFQAYKEEGWNWLGRQNGRFPANSGDP